MTTAATSRHKPARTTRVAQSPCPSNSLLQGRMRTVVACLGDSITEGSPHWDSRKRAGNPESQWQHWAALLHPGLELRNFGIWGERTDDIAARFDAAADGADVLILQGGINDIAQGRPIDVAARNLRALVDRGLALGLPVAVCDVLPWNNGWGGGGRAA